MKCFLNSDDNSEGEVKNEDLDLSDFNDDYQAYLEMFNSTNHPFGGGVPLTLDEFIRLNYLSESNHNDHISGLGFVNAIKPSDVIAGIQMAGNIYSEGMSAANTIKDEYIKLTNSAGRAKKMGDKFIDVSPKPGDSGQGRRGGLANGFGDVSGGTPFDVRRLNLNAKPIEVSLNTGIVPNTYGAYFMDADITHAPLHISSLRISLNTLTPSSSLTNFYNVVLTFLIQTQAQGSVSFNINADTNLSTTNITNYLDALMNALQTYYFYTSVLTYSSNPHNHNSGMLALRAMLSVDDLDQLYQLKRILEGLPLPPNMNNLLFYLMQTYKESSLPGAALLKILPISFNTTVDVNNRFDSLATGQVRAVLNNLVSNQSRLTGSILARVCPGWIATELLAPSEVPLHDLQFLTIWANLPGFNTTSGGIIARSPFAPSYDTSVVYNSFADTLDGAVFGLFTIYDTANAVWAPSLVDIVNLRSGYSSTRGTNRISYCIGPDGITRGFYPIVTNPDLAHSRSETYVTLTGVSGYQKFGSQAALNVNMNSVKETALVLLEWMLSIDTIGSGVKEQRMKDSKSVTHVNEGKGRSSSASKSKSRRSRPKSKNSKASKEKDEQFNSDRS